jgi:predicted phosphodiesterase
MKKLQYILLAAVAAVTISSCDKVSPIGVLVSGTGVEDRVKMSNIYFKEHKTEYKFLDASETGDEYTFLVGADSHLTDDNGRIAEMLQNGLDHNDLLYAHLGDIADTKAEYYITLEQTLDEYKERYAKKYYKEVNVLDTLLALAETDEEKREILNQASKSIYYLDEMGFTYTLNDIQFPFYPVVGNHDITHNGWALWSNIFHSSFYDVWVYVGDIGTETIFDHFIFLDTASGTLGEEQVDLIEQGYVDDKYQEEFGIRTRNTFVFTHTNIFRPRSVEFASTFPREEMFFLLDKFAYWNANIVFLGHVHKWDYQKVNGVEYLTLDSMSEDNNPEPGDYLVRVHCKRDGTITWEHVRMNYTPKKK